MNQSKSPKTSHRAVTQIRWASLIERPDCIPLPKRQPSGAKGAGLRYERQFARQFPQSLHGQWFEYEDQAGHGYCQPDLIVSYLPTCLVVFEVKYTLTHEAFFQLYTLYLPVVRAAMNAPVIGIVVARNLIPTQSMITPDLNRAIDNSPYGIPVLHWVGQGLSRSDARHPHPLKIKDPPAAPFQLAFPQKHTNNSTRRSVDLNRVCGMLSAPLMTET